MAAARSACINRVILVGGAGSLEVLPGVQLVDTAGFPDMDEPHALAPWEALAVLREEKDMNWTFFAPAAEIGPSEKKGNFRVGSRSLIVNASGHSQISCGAYADAFVTEIETGRYVKEIATAAYQSDRNYFEQLHIP